LSLGLGRLERDRAIGEALGHHAPPGDELVDDQPVGRQVVDGLGEGRHPLPQRREEDVVLPVVVVHELVGEAPRPAGQRLQAGHAVGLDRGVHRPDVAGKVGPHLAVDRPEEGEVGRGLWVGGVGGFHAPNDAGGRL
jgi:hypothetical protein